MTSDQVRNKKHMQVAKREQALRCPLSLTLFTFSNSIKSNRKIKSASIIVTSPVAIYFLAVMR